MQDSEVMTVLDKLGKFINEQPNLDPANYGIGSREGLAAMRGDARQISKQGTRARRALKEARSYQPNAEALLSAFKSAFSGRLSYDEPPGELNYCTGQYYPTEYRAAAATVLEYYCHAVKPKFMPEEGEVFTTTAQIERASQRAGSHFFDRDTMRFFRSRVLPQVFHGKGGVYFVTSEKGPNNVRRFTVRKFDPKTADIDTLGEFNELTRERALRIAKLAAEYPEAAKEALGA